MGNGNTHLSGFFLCQLDDLTPFKCLEVVLVIQLGEGELVFFLGHSGKPHCSAFNIDAGSALPPGFPYEPESLSRVESQTDTPKGVHMEAEDSVWRNCFQREQTLDPRMVRGSWRKSHTCSSKGEGATK